MVICLERGADLHMAQLMPLPLTISQIGFTFLVPTHLGSPGQRAVKRVCVLFASLRVTVNEVRSVSCTCTIHLAEIVFYGIVSGLLCFC